MNPSPRQTYNDSLSPVSCDLYILLKQVFEYVDLIKGGIYALNLDTTFI